MRSSDETVEKWISDVYQKEKTIEKVSFEFQNIVIPNFELNDAFCQQGMIALKNLLRPELYLKLREQIKSLKWKRQGPLNRRKYGILDRYVRKVYIFPVSVPEQNVCKSFDSQKRDP